MRYLLIMIVGLYFVGCGNASEPPTVQVQQSSDEKVSVQKSDTKVEEQSAKTHIRVLAEDTESKIPEYLIKLPIQTN